MVYMTGFLIPSRLGLSFHLFDSLFWGGRYRDGILFY